MGRYINVGNETFRDIVNGLYIDKTGLIEYVNSTIATPNRMTCMCRPRRFGKSFAAQMLCAYYDKSCDSRTLFEGLAISKKSDFEKHLNKYDVICLDMTWFVAKAKEIGETRSVLEIMQDEVTAELHSLFPNAEYKKSLPEMMYAVAEATGSRFIVIIDEWDALFRDAKNDRKQQEDYIILLRALFKCSTLTSKMIAAAYITGILPIKKYGTQSAMTDFREFTMIDPEPLEEYVGFTEQEVQQLCKNSPLKFADMKHWYNGYELGAGVNIYNPKSVIEAVQRRKISNYWTHSESYETLLTYIEKDFDGLREAIAQMVAGGSVKIDSISFQNDLITIHNRDDVLTLLVHLGYLTYDFETKAVSIPNEEIREQFLSAVQKGSRKELAQLIQNSMQLLEDTLDCNEEAVAAGIEAAHQICTSPHFYNDEQALRSVIRLAYLTCIDEYQRMEELPGGRGYADVVFVPKRHSALPAMVVELKWNRTAKAAIEQIKERNYPQILQGLTEKILLVGVNYDAKSKVHSCVIEEYEG